MPPVIAIVKKISYSVNVSFRQACLTCVLFTIPLANARGSDTRQANKSEPSVTESEPRALASEIVNKTQVKHDYRKDTVNPRMPGV